MAADLRRAPVHCRAGVDDKKFERDSETPRANVTKIAHALERSLSYKQKTKAAYAQNAIIAPLAC